MVVFGPFCPRLQPLVEPSIFFFCSLFFLFFFVCFLSLSKRSQKAETEAVMERASRSAMSEELRKVRADAAVSPQRHEKHNKYTVTQDM